MDTKHQPTTHDPLCECGYAKHDHIGGDGALAFPHPSGNTCQRFKRRDVPDRKVLKIDETPDDAGRPRNTLVSD